MCIDRHSRIALALVASALAVYPFASASSATLTKDNAEVVVAANAAPVVKFAAEEMTNFLAHVLGAPIPLVNSPTASRASIFLGDSEWSRAAGVDVSSLVRDAFVIKADGDRVYIAGRDDPKTDPWYVLDHGNWSPVLFDRATLFGVYEFLERFADVRFYFPGELGTIVPRKTAIEVSGECTVKPDFTSRFLQMWDGEYFEPDPKNRAKTLDYYRLRFETFRVPACHGSRSFMLQRRFGKTHPEYFCLLPNGKRDIYEEQVFDSVQPGQLCWTSGVVEEMYKDAVSYLKGEDASVRGIPAAWAKDGRFGWNGNCAYGKYVDIMPQDGMVPCGCERCRKIIDACRAKGKTEETDLIWGVVSNFAARLTADGLKGSVSMMAYNGYKDVPDFALPSNIEVVTAIYGQWHKQGTKNRADAVAIAKTWAEKLGHPIRMWNYPCKLLGLDVKAKDVPQNCPRAWANFYKEMAPYVNGAFAESETDRWFFNYLNYYVFSKVCWDNDVDVDALLDEHYRLMFGAGAKDMAEVYETLETCWMDGVVGKTVETPMGPVVKRPSDAQMWEEVYSPAKIARMEACVKAALSKVASGSLEARRIALVDREFLGGLRRRQTDYAKFAAGLKALRLELAVGEEKSLSLVPYSTRLKKLLAAGKKTVRTDVRVRRETDALVVTFDCEEPLMSNVAAQVHEPDYPQLWQENVVEVVIDPIGDFTSYAQIFVNSEGSITDQMWSRIYLPTEGLKWNSGTTAKITKGEKSWTAVLTIPLKAFPNLPKDFAIEFARERNVTGTADTFPLYHWSPYAYGFSDLENLGRIVFK